MNFITKGFRTIVFIFINISTTFWPICSSSRPEDISTEMLRPEDI